MKEHLLLDFQKDCSILLLGASWIWSPTNQPGRLRPGTCRRPPRVSLNLFSYCEAVTSNKYDSMLIPEALEEAVKEILTLRFMLVKGDTTVSYLKLFI